MKIKILRPYLDFEVGKTYTAESTAQGNYMIAMNIGKEVVAKDGKAEVAPVEKAKVATKPKAKAAPVEKAEVKPVIDDEDLELF